MSAIALFSIISIIIDHSVGQIITIEPSGEIRLHEGDQLELGCVVRDPLYTRIEWFFEKKRLSVNVDSSDSKYSVALFSTQKTGLRKYVLSTNVTKEDDGTFKCKPFKEGQNAPRNVQKKPVVVSYIPASMYPLCSYEAATHNLECSSEMGKPVKNLTWNQYVTEIQSTNHIEDRFNQKQIVHLIDVPPPLTTNDSLVCSFADEVSRNCSIKYGDVYNSIPPPLINPDVIFTFPVSIDEKLSVNCTSTNLLTGSNLILDYETFPDKITVNYVKKDKMFIFTDLPVSIQSIRCYCTLKWGNFQSLKSDAIIIEVVQPSDKEISTTPELTTFIQPSKVTNQTNLMVSTNTYVTEPIRNVHKQSSTISPASHQTFLPSLSTRSRVLSSDPAIPTGMVSTTLNTPQVIGTNQTLAALFTTLKPRTTSKVTTAPLYSTASSTAKRTSEDGAMHLELSTTVTPTVNHRKTSNKIPAFIVSINPATTLQMTEEQTNKINTKANTKATVRSHLSSESASVLSTTTVTSRAPPLTSLNAQSLTTSFLPSSGEDTNTFSSSSAVVTVPVSSTRVTNTLEPTDKQSTRFPDATSTPPRPSPRKDTTTFSSSSAVVTLPVSSTRVTNTLEPTDKQSTRFPDATSTPPRSSSRKDTTTFSSSSAVVTLPVSSTRVTNTLETTDKQSTSFPDATSTPPRPTSRKDTTTFSSSSAVVTLPVSSTRVTNTLEPTDKQSTSFPDATSTPPRPTSRKDTTTFSSSSVVVTLPVSSTRVKNKLETTDKQSTLLPDATSTESPKASKNDNVTTFLGLTQQITMHNDSHPKKNNYLLIILVIATIVTVPALTVLFIYVRRRCTEQGQYV
ncbi:uncharacterized protein [Apostichopus japonicus]|uniref:uncharacterized protein n=1 Tax=Stichopus japonicus TaxID=307972 RepID=UPI003AB122F0